VEIIRERMIFFARDDMRQSKGLKLEESVTDEHYSQVWPQRRHPRAMRLCP